jgi:hypothetical protein
LNFTGSFIGLHAVTPGAGSISGVDGITFQRAEAGPQPPGRGNRESPGYSPGTGSHFFCQALTLDKAVLSPTSLLQAPTWWCLPQGSGPRPGFLSSHHRKGLSDSELVGWCLFPCSGILTFTGSSFLSAKRS